MTFAGLLANLGGSLGLIVSVSVFTVFEIVELFFLIMHVLFSKWTNTLQGIDLAFSWREKTSTSNKKTKRINYLKPFIFENYYIFIF